MHLASVWLSMFGLHQLHINSSAISYKVQATISMAGSYAVLVIDLFTGNVIDFMA